MRQDNLIGTGRRRMGVDFGTDSTVVAIRDESGRIRLHDFPGWTSPFPSGIPEHPVPRVPSQILYSETGTRSIGAAVTEAGTNPAGTVRWLRHYILGNSTVQVPSGTGRMTGYRNAGSDFLTALLTHASGNSTGTTEVVFSIPVDAPPHYSAWLGAVAMAAGYNVPFVIDEASAAVAGYNQHLSVGSLYLLADFHADGLDISLITPEEFSKEAGGIFSRVLGKAHEDTGGSVIDGWMVQDILARARLHEADSREARILPFIKHEAGNIREALVLDTETEICATDPVSGFCVTEHFSRADLCRILEEHQFFTKVNQVLDRALSAAGIRGEGEERITAVLMVGECSAIPCIQDAVKLRWGAVRVFCDHPTDAVARGAALANPETIEPDRIRNDYALRHWDPVAREYRYRFIVRNGARYPSAGQVARITISGAYDGQTHLGIPLCELRSSGNDPHGHIELVSNTRGEMQIAGSLPDAIPEMQPVLMNEQEPTLLHASPPAQKGEPRFELTFFLDRQGYLCLTARDLLTGLIVKRDAQISKLN